MAYQGKKNYTKQILSAGSQKEKDYLLTLAANFDSIASRALERGYPASEVAFVNKAKNYRDLAHKIR